ncbi:nicotinamidase [uncultured Brachyspira sp.]|uniref:nicotinamidase n=1 Tax=uncultured Brachyspira sp. TaxID=221953 RepID=UPI00260109BA|nr:nicotinamidase [uncultured Brachyspira sp.]
MSVKIPYEKIVNEDYVGKEINPVNQQEIYSLALEYSDDIIKNLKDESINLLIVDPQRDFVDIEKGALPIKGAADDLKRIIRFIYDNMSRLSSIYVTLDTHRYDSIFYPIMWKDYNRKPLTPFTEVTLEKIENDEIIPIYDEDIQIDYVRKLKWQNSQNLIIWPYHCIYGTDGWLIDKQLSNMLLFFEASRKIYINKILKGQDSFSEMYGVIRPEVITEYTKEYDNSWAYDITNADKIYICGEAKDYCVYESVKQFCEIYCNDRYVTETINVMMNCSSAIGDEEKCNKKYEDLSKEHGIKLINI